MKRINIDDFFIGIPSHRIELVRAYLLGEVDNKKIEGILTKQEIQHISDTLYMNVEHVISGFTRGEFRKAYSLLSAIDKNLVYILIGLNPNSYRHLIDKK